MQLTRKALISCLIALALAHEVMDLLRKQIDVRLREHLRCHVPTNFLAKHLNGLALRRGRRRHKGRRRGRNKWSLNLN